MNKATMNALFDMAFPKEEVEKKSVSTCGLRMRYTSVPSADKKRMF